MQSAIIPKNAAPECFQRIRTLQMLHARKKHQMCSSLDPSPEIKEILPSKSYQVRLFKPSFGYPRETTSGCGLGRSQRPVHAAPFAARYHSSTAAAIAKHLPKSNPNTFLHSTDPRHVLPSCSPNAGNPRTYPNTNQKLKSLLIAASPRRTYCSCCL